MYVVRKWPLRGRRRFVCVGISDSKSVVTVHRAFRAKFAKDTPTDKTIREWCKQLTETGCLCKQKLSGRPLLNTLRTREFKLFKRPFPGFLTILTL